MDYQHGQFEIEGKLFNAQKMPAKKQFHVARRLAPVLETLDGLIPLLKDDVSFDDEERNLEAIFAIIKPFASVLQKMSDDDAEYILNQCLANCKIDVNGKWANLRNGDRDMYQDISLTELVVIAFNVIKFNLSDFTRAPQPASLQPGRSQGAR